MARVFINCREAHALLSHRCDSPLPLFKRVLLRVHLLGCDACSIVARQLAFLSRAVRRLGT